MQLVDQPPRRPLPIRLTPLIDVVFILLVFFMLTTRLLPVSTLALDNQTATARAPGDPVPTVTVEADGQLRWQGTTGDPNAIAARLRNAGITEVNLATAPEARLTHLTGALSQLDSAHIRAHWQRRAPATP
ncbi:ExbD/TolR family protein [Marinobacter sp. C2H3]|uniref:ExbD/TolR family protein n=1 Tax=Marinobacter sp. C2H3 TaxID=3119003 RepID=UPI00300EB6C9